MELVCEALRCGSAEEFFQLIGAGGLPLKEAVLAIRDRLYGGRALLLPPTGTLNRIYPETLDPAVIKFSRCCHPVPVDKGLIGLLSERGISVHSKECEKIAELKVQREDVVELRWKLKETRVEKQQTIVFLQVPSRNRLLMLLSVAPEEMRISEIILLSGQSIKFTAWEVKFSVETLQGLKNIISHFKKSALYFEFDLEH
ncbi:MAG TPA: bifunctional (p)ppGpp synthetase/guanosine-3',5'-bis(diphosphate) 3'-pyrophosphohydrolase, partial [Desulfurivibrionaceae bacterium]|nr:bifunctional (p)ppGpp synthetase/guanosine-3',5'-bis(diphosphate) 3'-pyrophosphohydrolase [Desulfurivibrionaceae bacterium]